MTPSPLPLTRKAKVAQPDCYPTPAWVTRALLRWLWYERPPWCIGTLWDGWNKKNTLCWEPAVGRGHIAEVLIQERVNCFGSDLHNYDNMRVPADKGLSVFAPLDFTLLDSGMAVSDYTSIITNPPFKLWRQFTTAALHRMEDSGRCGLVAMFGKHRALEGKEKYNAIYKNKPPSAVLYFSERVQMGKTVKRNWNSSECYAWFIWAKCAMGEKQFDFIPPGTEEKLWREGDEDLWKLAA